MNNHPSFATKFNIQDNTEYSNETLKSHGNDKWSIVGYDLKPGIYIKTGYNEIERRTVYRPIKEVIEERPSSGDFPNHNRPNWYLVSV